MMSNTPAQYSQYRDDLSLLQAHQKRLRWTLDEVYQARDKALRRLLKHAYEHSSWYKERLKGINIDQCTAENISQIPAMTKSDLMAHWDEIITDKRLRLADIQSLLQQKKPLITLFDHQIIPSGGTTGIPGIFAWDPLGFAHQYHLYNRYQYQAELANPNKPDVVKTAIVTGGSPLHITSRIFTAFSTSEFPFYLIGFQGDIASVVAELNQLQPHRLQGYPSLLVQLAQEAKKGRLHIQPHRITVHSEPVTPEMKSQLLAAWPVPFCNLYGSTEGGTMAIGCGQSDGMHLSTDMLLFETDINQGKTYLTNLHNFVMPLIRYEMQDTLQILKDSCPCGSHYPRIADIATRAEDTLRYASDVVISIRPLQVILEAIFEISEYQVKQLPNGMEILIAGQETFPKDKMYHQLYQLLVGAGMKDPKIIITQVATIPRLPSGKIRRIIPLD